MSELDLAEMRALLMQAGSANDRLSAHRLDELVDSVARANAAAGGAFPIHVYVIDEIMKDERIPPEFLDGFIKSLHGRPIRPGGSRRQLAPAEEQPPTPATIPATAPMLSPATRG